MIGIVIVSHSADLANGLKVLAQQMGQGKLKIEAAGGVDDPEDPIGTDAMKILAAIQEVYSDDGVLVFMDMGSAILSTEMALDFLDDDKKSNIVLSGAPVVEGVIAASVAAASDATIEEVQKEVETALNGKRAQLSLESESSPGPVSEPIDDKSEESFAYHKQYHLDNALGLHARPAAKVAAIASKHDATVQFRNSSKDSHWVNAESLNSLITLQVSRGDKLEIRIRGSQAKDVFEKLDPLLSESFYEPAELPESKAPKSGPENEETSSEFYGIPIGSGIAIAPAFFLDTTLPEIKREESDDQDKEIQKLEQGLNSSIKELEKLKLSGAGDSDIFDAHILLLKDPEWIDRVKKMIEKESVVAAYAWKKTLDKLLKEYRESNSVVVNDRAADLMDVGSRVLEKLTNVTNKPEMPDRPSVLVVEELTPSIVSGIEPDKIEAIITAKGSATSHSAILVRSIGIPAVFSVKKRINEIRSGNTLIVDGEEGVVIPEPDNETLAVYQDKKSSWLKRRERAAKVKEKEFTDSLGKRIFIEANIAVPDEADSALRNGAEGVGLFRTEFLYMQENHPPSEEEQLKAYSTVLKKMKGLPVTFRTVDIGGDKPIPYLNIEREENPFLGWRGIRYSLDEKELFKTQLLSLLRASVNGKAKIMFPMVSTPEEFTEARSILDSVQKELTDHGVPFSTDIPIGMMVEVPAAVIRIDEFLEIADFISIGTNDLTQYIMAADRNNAKVSGLASYRQPAVLNFIEQIIQKAKKKEVPVSICGEMAGDSAMTQTLMEFGLRSFSMNASGIPEFKLHLEDSGVGV
jgi:phosphocarrier protein FPr